LGDIPALMASIEDIGLLQPVVLTPNMELLAGQRRVEAYRRLKRTTIPAAVVVGFESAVSQLKAERDENTCREPLLPSEMVAIGLDIEAIEKPKAIERQKEHGGTAPGKKKHSAQIAQSVPGRVTKKVAAVVGIGERTYEKAKAVAATKDTALIQRMDTESVDAAYKELQRREGITVHYSSDSPDWKTPPHVIKAVLAVLGKIDLDPCSNEDGNANVPAKKHFTRTNDGLAQKWQGKVYMNPPYGREIQGWTEKLKAEFEAGNVTEAVALVPARTDTEWFNALRDYVRCFIRGRLAFGGKDVAANAPFPSAAIYFGKNVKGFVKGFSALGDCFARTDG